MKPVKASIAAGMNASSPYSWSNSRPGAPVRRWMGFVWLSDPYGADGENVPQITWKNANQRREADDVGHDDGQRCAQRRRVSPPPRRTRRAPGRRRPAPPTSGRTSSRTTGAARQTRPATSHGATRVPRPGHDVTPTNAAIPSSAPADLRVERERVDQPRCAQGDRGPRPGRGTRRSRASHRPPPRDRDRERRHQHLQGDGGEIATQRVHRREQHAETDGVNRVDLPIGTARHVVGREIAREVLAVVAARVVVLDPQVAVTPEALRDHEVVRLVSRREQRGIRQACRGERRAEDRDGEDRDDGQAPRPGAC